MPPSLEQVDSANDVAELLEFLYQSPVSLIQTDLQGKVEMMTPVAAQTLLPLAPASRLDNLFEVLEPVMPGLTAQVANFSPSHGTICTAWAVPLACDGEHRPPRYVSIRVLRVDVRRLMVMLSDVSTETRAALETLRVEERRIKALNVELEHALEVSGLVVKREDLSTGLIECGANLLKWFGVASLPGQARLANLLPFIHPDDREHFLADREQARSGRQTTLRECRYFRADGQIGYFTGSRYLERDEQGRPIRLTSFLIDISEQRRADLARAAQQAAEDASRAKSTFLSKMSHELRTPLTGIMGFAELLLHIGEKKTPERRAEFAQHILNSGRHLMSIINDLLDMSRIEIGALKVSVGSVDLFTVVGQVLREQQAEVTKRSLAVTTRCDAPDRPMVKADPTRLRQVLTNLVSNAIKYNRPAGSITIACSRQPGGWRVSVIDTGIGMSQEQLDAMFQPFNRLGRELGNIKGIGIGLAITRELIAAMGGELSVQSLEGVGTSFHVDLAAAKSPSAASAAQPAEPLRPADPPRRRQRVLCVDDDDIQRLLITETLAVLPELEIEAVADATSALDAAHQGPIDLLLLDLELPDIDGDALLRILREQVAPQPLRCLLLSGSDIRTRVTDGLLGEVDAFLSKPWQAAALRREVSLLLGRRSYDGDASAPIAPGGRAGLVGPPAQDARQDRTDASPAS